MMWYLQVYSSEVYLESCQTSKTGLFWKNKVLSDYICKKTPWSWMFDRVLKYVYEVYAINRYLFYVVVVSTK